jgi:hypothetical protein
VSTPMLTVFLRNARPGEEVALGDAVHAVLERDFLGREYRIKSSRSGKEWL